MQSPTRAPASPPENDENVMPPHRYSISPGAYSPFDRSCDERRTSQLYSPFRMGAPSPTAPPSTAKKYGAIGKPSSSLANALEKRKRQLSSLTSGLFAKFALPSGNSTPAPVAEGDYEDYDVSRPGGEGGGSPLKRNRRGMAPPLAPPPIASVASKFAEGIAKLPPPSKVLREASTKVASAGQSLQAAARATLQAVDDEADMVFDGVEQQFEAISTKVRAATATATDAVASRLVRRNSRDATAAAAAASSEGQKAQPAQDEAAAAATATVEGALSAVVDSMRTVGGTLEGSLSAAEERLLAVGGAVELAVTSAVTERVSGVQQKVSTTAIAVHDTLGAVGGAAVGAAVGAVGASVQSVSEGLSEFESAVGQTATSLKAGGASTLRAMEAYEASLDETFDRAVEDAVGAAASVVGSAATLFSPSAVSEGAAALISPVVGGLAGSFPEMRESVKELSDSVTAGNAYLEAMVSHTVSEVRGVFAETAASSAASAASGGGALAASGGGALAAAPLMEATLVPVDVGDATLDDELEAALAEPSPA